MNWILRLLSATICGLVFASVLEIAGVDGFAWGWFTYIFYQFMFVLFSGKIMQLFDLME